MSRFAPVNPLKSPDAARSVRGAPPEFAGFCRELLDRIASDLGLGQTPCEECGRFTDGAELECCPQCDGEFCRSCYGEHWPRADSVKREE